MATRIISDPWTALKFVRKHYAMPASEHMKGISLERDGKVIAAVIYEGWNGSNVWMHVAAEPGGKWLTKEFLNYVFHYPFHEVGVQRISGWVEADNAQARRFDEHLGFRQEAVLKGAGNKGADVIVYVMKREDCRYGQEH